MGRHSDNKTKITDKFNNRRKVVYKTTIYPNIDRHVTDIYIDVIQDDRLDNLAYKYYSDVKLWWVLAEANKLAIRSFAMNDTNTNPSQVSFPIPANDDASKSIECILSIVSKAIAEGLEERNADQDKKADEKKEKAKQIAEKAAEKTVEKTVEKQDKAKQEEK